MKVLVNCYACSPYKGSEPGMGWNFVKCLSRMHELHIITETKFRADIERYFEENPEERSFFRFYYLDKTRHKKLRKIWPPSYYWFYKVWQKKAYALALELDKNVNFDVIHQLNMVGYREPGYLWRMEKPFVWGPIGGFGITPWCMLPSMGLKGCIYYFFRNVLNIIQMYSLRRVKKAVKKADELIAATQSQSEYISRLYKRNCIIIPEVGLETSLFITNNDRKVGEPLRICWSGQHTPGKALNLLLDALGMNSSTDVELHIIGQGEKTEYWKRMARKINKKVVWYGQTEKLEAHKIMQSCHLMCITSLKDLTSTVLLEALSFGLPIIALDHCGFSNVITEECGRKIDIFNKKQVVRDLSKAIDEIARNEDLRRRLSEGARKRALEFNWEDKAKTISQIYESISV